MSASLQCGERAAGEERKDTEIKTGISDQLALPLFQRETVILTITYGCVDGELCNKWSTLRNFAKDESVSGS